MSDYMSYYTKQDEDDFGVQCYSDIKITEKILEEANGKTKQLYDDLKNIKNIEVYRYNISNEEAPQTVLKIYKINCTHDETQKILIGILDVSVNEVNNKLEFCFYNVNKVFRQAYAQFIKGVLDTKDGITIPVQKDEFNIKDINSLIDDIYNIYS